MGGGLEGACALNRGHGPSLDVARVLASCHLQPPTRKGRRGSNPVLSRRAGLRLRHRSATPW